MLSSWNDKQKQVLRRVRLTAKDKKIIPAVQLVIFLLYILCCHSHTRGFVGSPSMVIFVCLLAFNTPPQGKFLVHISNNLPVKLRFFSI
jgi:hypothetical protein